MACAQPKPVGTLRFKNAAPVWVVNDRMDVPQKPQKLPFGTSYDLVQSVFTERIDRTLKPEDRRRALSTNSLGEVPNSTWFTNRIGKYDLTAEQIARGPNQHAGPDLTQPLRIKSTKMGGNAVGFIVEDSRGDSYILKFDEPHIPLLETATDVIVQRLLWACGYHVPENTVIALHPRQLVLNPDAKIADEFGHHRALTPVKLDELLQRVHRDKNGHIRALASKYLAGKPLGGFPKRGTRKDDPNDTIPHQHRREIRGLYVFFSWLQNTDAKRGNTLDMWMPDPNDNNRHFVVHYLLDFGKALGSFRTITSRESDGYREVIDFKIDLASILSFGLWKRPWERVEDPNLPGVGFWDASHYSPGSWKSHRPYLPFAYKDNYDMFWAAKIMMRLTPVHIRAAVEQGRIHDPRSVEHLIKVLIARQRKTGHYWFSRVNPLDQFQLSTQKTTAKLCFADLLVAYRLAPQRTQSTHYHLQSFDFAGKPVGKGGVWITANSGRACAKGLQLTNRHQGYTIIRIVTHRSSSEPLTPVEVHVAKSARGKWRIIGIHRR